MKNIKYNKPKKYACIVKVSCEGCRNCDGIFETGKPFKKVKCQNDKFLKYRLNDLKKFVAFLDNKHPNWKWFNVYCNKHKHQLTSYMQKKRP